MNKLSDILNGVTPIPPKKFYKTITEKICNKEKCFVVTANPEIIMLGRKNDAMYKVLKKAVIIPDGIGVVKALQYMGKNCERNTGIDLVEFLLKYADKMALRVFIYGAKQNVLQDFQRVCETRWKNINFVGMYNGYTNKKEDVERKIRNMDCDIVLVALGTPAQELFIASFYDEIENGIFVGVGGSIDVISGNVKRAPAFFLKNNLEWLYRIVSEPQRLKRFWSGNIVFVFVLIKEWITDRLRRRKTI